MALAMRPQPALSLPLPLCWPLPLPPPPLLSLLLLLALLPPRVLASETERSDERGSVHARVCAWCAPASLAPPLALSPSRVHAVMRWASPLGLPLV